MTTRARIKSNWGYTFLNLVFNLVLYGVPLGLLLLYMNHGGFMYHLDLHDYLTLLRWGHL